MKKYTQVNNLFQPWFLVIYIPLFVMLGAFYLKSPQNLSTGRWDIWVMLAVGLPLLFIGLMRLTVSIDKDKIEYQYFPVNLKKRQIAWADVVQAQVVKFDPIRNYAGYGYRRSSKYGLGMITKWNTGLFIMDKRGNKLTIEIADPVAFGRFIQEQGLYQVNTQMARIEEVA